MMKEMEPLIAEAEAKGLWLHCSYQDLWFSPQQLRERQAQGRFRWGPVNWTLRDPQERLNQAERRVVEAQAERDRIAAETK